MKSDFKGFIFGIISKNCFCFEILNHFNVYPWISPVHVFMFNWMVIINDISRRLTFLPLLIQRA